MSGPPIDVYAAVSTVAHGGIKPVFLFIVIFYCRQSIIYYQNKKAYFNVKGFYFPIAYALQICERNPFVECTGTAGRVATFVYEVDRLYQTKDDTFLKYKIIMIRMCIHCLLWLNV